jgi:uncharacterized protein YegL
MTTPVPVGATLVAVLVDRSGSMAQCRDEMERGLNDFVADQATLPQAGAFMLGQFDDCYEVVMPMRPITGVPTYRLRPSGRTALYDAVGKYITNVNERLAQDNTYRPVIMCIITDGAENASKEWTLEAVQKWIEHMRTVYGWTFVFLGANIDAVKTAAKMGIPTENALTFDTKRGKESYQLLSKHVGEIRKGRHAEFSADDRRKAIEG